MMQSWQESIVCMMSGVGPAGAAIKQEENSYSRRRDISCSSPSTTQMTSELDYSESGEECTSPSPIKMYPDSPDASPDHFCSSTTVGLGGESSMASSEGMRDDDAPKRSCLVCGDIASGFHYGVASCEACKAFFKRTIQGNIDYTCPAGSDCEINKRRRKACQACRFHKCLRVGMLKEGVRLDRVRGGRQKYRRTSESNFTNIAPVPMKRSSVDEIVLLSALRSCEPETILALPDLTVSDPEFVTISTLADLYDRELVSTIGWAKQIPGFTELALNDQMRLLQSTWGEILTLSLAYRSMSQHSNTLNFAQDFVMEEKQARECNAMDLFNQILGIVDRLEQNNICQEELLLLKALVLTNSDVRVQDNQALQKLKCNILQSLHEVVATLRSRDSVVHLQNLLLILPSLRAVDSTLRKFWLSVRHQGSVPMNKLFVEMLESHMR